jgi:hypothetical protein
MAKKRGDMSDKESQIAELRAELAEVKRPVLDKIKAIKDAGSFKSAYRAVREGTVKIAKSQADENSKKAALNELFETVSESME